MTKGTIMQKSMIKDEIYRKILKRIMTGEFKVDAVYTEKDLADQFGVSKTPVREALIQLCSEGILENFPRFGYKLVEIRPSDIADVVEYRKIIEVEALKLCFYDISPEHIELLKNISNEYEKMQGSEDIYSTWQNNVKFHLALTELCSNKYIQNSISAAINLSTRFVFQYFKNKKEQNLDNYFHNDIISAIENKDLDTAVKILSEDVLLLTQGNSHFRSQFW